MAHYRDERPFVLERERSPSRDRTPAFLRDVRRPEAGPMVLRQREVETATRPHHRSPSPAFVERREVVHRPPPDQQRGRSVSRVRSRIARRDESESSLSTSSYSSSESPVQRRPVFRRPRSVSPGWRETVRTRIRRESPSPSPSPPPQPQAVKGPTVEREVITHYTDVDHGVVRARQPSPQPPPPPRAKSRPRNDTTDIDIYTSRHETDINIRRDSHGRPLERKYADQDGLQVVDHRRRRRAHSAAPLPARDPMREEAEYLNSQIDARGRPGEAYHGATRDWSIVDVPPGTERVTMDGAGGASTETTWQRYSGVRRTKFIPERDELPALEAPQPRSSRDRLSVHIGSGDREVDVRRDRRVSQRPKDPVMEKWTEITRDLVNKEAIERMGYSYEERGQFFYIMQYLHKREIDELVELTDDIRRSRRLKKRQLLRDDWETERSIRIHQHRHRHHHDSPHRFRHEEPRYEKQVSWERRRNFA